MTSPPPLTCCCCCSRTQRCPILTPTLTLVSPSPPPQTTYERARGRRARPTSQCIGGRRCLPLRCQTQHERAGSHPCADGRTGRRHWASRFLPSTRRDETDTCDVMPCCRRRRLSCWLCRVCIESAGMRMFACGGLTGMLASDKVMLECRPVCLFPSAFSSRWPMHDDKPSQRRSINSRIQSAAVQYRP
jgi:hypothetical protein